MTRISRAIAVRVMPGAPEILRSTSGTSWACHQCQPFRPAPKRPRFRPMTAAPAMSGVDPAAGGSPARDGAVRRLGRARGTEARRAKERGADARMGDEDVAEALPGARRLEGGVGEAFRSESADDPGVDRDGSVGPGPVDRWLVLHAAATGGPQAGSATPGSSIRVLRSVPGCRRSDCLMRSARRATRVATAECGTTSARCVGASRPRRWCGLRRRRDVRARWSLRRSPCRGAASTPGGGADPERLAPENSIRKILQVTSAQADVQACCRSR